MLIFNESRKIGIFAPKPNSGFLFLYNTLNINMLYIND